MTFLIGLSPGPGVLSIVSICAGAGWGTVRSAMLGSVLGNLLAATVVTEAAATAMSWLHPSPGVLAKAAAAYLVGLGVLTARAGLARTGPDRPTLSSHPGARAFLASSLNPKSYAFLAMAVPLLAVSRPGGSAVLWAAPPLYAGVLCLTTFVYAAGASRLRSRRVARLRLCVSSLCGAALASAGGFLLLFPPS